MGTDIRSSLHTSTQDTETNITPVGFTYEDVIVHSPGTRPHVEHCWCLASATMLGVSVFDIKASREDPPPQTDDLNAIQNEAEHEDVKTYGNHTLDKIT